MRLADPLPGTKFGRLTVIRVFMRREGASPSPRKSCECACQCGAIKTARLSHLLQGKVVSCGCYKDENTSKRFRKTIKEGTHFGYLKVIREETQRLGHTRRMLCQCICGSEKAIPLAYLTQGGVKSCGCQKSILCKENATTHGHAGSPTYRAWVDMIKRGKPDYKNSVRYFDRGIRVACRWKKFKNFLADMGEKPGAEFSLDRIDNDGGYRPGNCRWATRVQQANNKRNNARFTYKRKSYTLAELARMSGQPYQRIQMRLRSGWSVEDAVELPIQKKHA